MAKLPYSSKYLIAYFKGEGAFAGHPGGHALKVLGEAVELAVKSGVSEPMIMQCVHSEVAKASSRGELGQVSISGITEEAADVSLCLESLIGFFGVDVSKAKCEKFETIQGREWAVCAHGALWRPDRVPNYD